MTDFSITEDFPKTEIEFDQRFRDIDAVAAIRQVLNGPAGSYAKTVGTRPTVLCLSMA
jgi:hypothetical protein